MDVGTLGLNSPAKPPSRQSTKTQPSAKKTKPTDSRNKHTNKKSKQTDAFSSLGLMSVDDLLANQASPVHTASQSESVISSYRSRNSYSESSIHTYKDSVQTASIDSEIRTHSTTKVDDYASDFDDTLRETESIATDEGTSKGSVTDPSYR